MRRLSNSSVIYITDFSIDVRNQFVDVRQNHRIFISMMSFKEIISEVSTVRMQLKERNTEVA